jgi:hypothetical protein
MARSLTASGGGAAPLPLNYQHNLSNPPVTLCVDLSSEKAINQFVTDQQELQINELRQ